MRTMRDLLVILLASALCAGVFRWGVSRALRGVTAQPRAHAAAPYAQRSRAVRHDALPVGNAPHELGAPSAVAAEPTRLALIEHAPASAAAHRAAPRAHRFRPVLNGLSVRDDGHVRLDAACIQRLSSSIRGTRARIAPQGGLELTALDQQGYLHAAGIHAGDCLVEIDGRPTRTLDELLGAYSQIRNRVHTTLRLRRGTRDLLLHVELAPGTGGVRF